MITHRGEAGRVMYVYLQSSTCLVFASFVSKHMIFLPKKKSDSDHACACQVQPARVTDQIMSGSIAQQVSRELQGDFLATGEFEFRLHTSGNYT